MASVGLALVLMLVWFAVALLFRWRFQFSIRSLLVLTVAVAIPCSWLGVEMKKAKEQKEAVAAIQKLGGKVYWEARLPGPAWWLGLPGDEAFATPTGVNWSNTQVVDAALQNLTRLSQLQELGLEETRVTDAGLENLKGLNQLRLLWLTGTEVTDEGVTKLQQALPNCRIIRWQDVIRDSMCEESEKERLLIWLKDPNGIALLRHLSVMESTDGEKTYHNCFRPMFNGINWKGAFTDVATGAKRQVLLYSSPGIRPALTTIVVIDQDSHLVQWTAPSIGADVARASMRNTEAGVELILDAYTMGPLDPNHSRGIYRFSLRNDGIIQLHVKWCKPDYESYLASFGSGRRGGVIEFDEP